MTSDPVPPTQLHTPADGVPDVITTNRSLAEYAERARGGDGPVALDAERASGFRYSQRAYLIQVRTREAGTALIDPIEINDFSPLADALDHREWILHAASQDLACLSEVGLVPRRIFDTELAGRLVGRERVGLAAIVESELGLLLEKGHGAADWSTRPLPANWLNYAALDVEVLIELRDVLDAELRDAGKREWAEQEFEHVRMNLASAPVRIDPWRRTSGIHKVRQRRNLAVVRELWLERDRVAKQRDIASGRILPDKAIVEAATVYPKTLTELGKVAGFTGKGQQRRLPTWWSAVERAQRMDEHDWPQQPPPSDGPPAVRNWAEKNPEAFARLEAAKRGIAVLSAERSVPAENLMQPELVRRACWENPPDLAEYLARGGARPWQIALLMPILQPSEDFVTGE